MVGSVGAVVVDASLVVARLLPEKHSAKAGALLARSVADNVRLIGSPLLPIEVANALFQRLRRGDLAEADVAAAFSEFDAFGILPEPVADLHAHAFAFSRQHRLPNVYDCVYVVLAQREGAEL